MKERLKELRICLNMSQEEFGAKIGIKSRAHISSLENGSRNITDRIINDICNTYGVCESWLRDGFGEMFIKPATFSLDEYARSKSLKETEINLIRGYMELDPNTRNDLFNMFKKVFSPDIQDNKEGNFYDECPKTPEDLEKLYPPVDFKKSTDVS